ncbi:MAG TPA: phosphoribosylformylglycinamidine cyclo-ligase [Actinomycetota bacterium]|nr:phosphoribosylformylglycinamidine cyclo-ligase [Actinomycetota bacterium]
MGREPESPGPEAYRVAGVDLAAGAQAVELIRDVARGAARPGAVGEIGGFSGLFDLGDGRYLSAATDGVGTKLEVARRAGRYDTVGIDLVGMSANDVVCTGAEPLFFLDYLAVERVVPEQVAAIVEGVAEGCRRAGCALLGGETAEHPGTMPEGSFDLAGFCVGIVERGQLLAADRVEAGDALIGFRSSGLHANGYSLVRRVLPTDDRDLAAVVPQLGRPLVDELLEPTALYVRPLLSLRDAGLAKSAAHITGGGLHENVPRALPAGLGAEIDRAAWTPPPIFGMVAEAAGTTTEELFGVLNMGIGMIVAVAPGDAPRAVRIAGEGGVEAVEIGAVVGEPGVRLR